MSKAAIIRSATIVVLTRNKCDGVMWGDTFLLDEIGAACAGLNMRALHPLNRHRKILNALDRDPVFKKSYIRLRGQRGNNLVRCFTIRGKS